MRHASHIAIGVREMDRSLAFYRDLLGMEVVRDTTNEPKGGDGLFFAPTESQQRREVFLRLGGNADLGHVLLILSQPDRAVGNEPLRLDQVGIHHVGFWVDDVDERAARCRGAGVTVLVHASSTGDKYGEAATTPMRTLVVQDPDGTIVQFDQRVG